MRPDRELLHSFEWHDLPVDELAIMSDGLSLIVTPYDESLRTYRRMRLALTAAEQVELALTGTLSEADLSRLEVSSFEIVDESDDHLSGRLGILPGAAGFWTIGFVRAKWQLVELDDPP